jgi:peroxiredoxin
MANGKPMNVTAKELFSGKSVALFGVPGAFTPSCHHVHLPEVLQDFDSFRENGIDLVACTAVNDVYVLDAWSKALGASGKILFLADGNGEFARSLGLVFDGRALGLGFRSKRYSMWVTNGAIQHLAIERDPTHAEISSAHSMLSMFERWDAGSARGHAENTGAAS